MDLQWFVNNVSGKVIQVEYNNGDGDLISLVNLCVNDAEMERQQYFDILKLNGNLQFYIEDTEVNELDTCLCFYRGGKGFSSYLFTK